MSSEIPNWCSLRAVATARERRLAPLPHERALGVGHCVWRRHKQQLVRHLGDMGEARWRCTSWTDRGRRAAAHRQQLQSIDEWRVLGHPASCAPHSAHMWRRAIGCPSGVAPPVQKTASSPTSRVLAPTIVVVSAGLGIEVLLVRPEQRVLRVAPKRRAAGRGQQRHAAVERRRDVALQRLADPHVAGDDGVRARVVEDACGLVAYGGWRRVQLPCPALDSGCAVLCSWCVSVR